MKRYIAWAALFLLALIAIPPFVIYWWGFRPIIASWDKDADAWGAI